LRASAAPGASAARLFVCDGTPHIVPVTVRPNVVSGVTLRPFKQGGAAVTATVGESTPSGSLSATVGPLEIRLKK
jgi:hypothetical protein